VLRADDLGVLRGDGIFETLLVRDGAAWLLDDHLQRLAGSAVRMDLADIAQLFHDLRENSLRDGLTGCFNRTHALEVCGHSASLP